MTTSLIRSLVSFLLALALLGGAAAAELDPPARVGRASLVEGDVAYLRDGEWVPLPLNWPITTGTRLSAAPGARAELRAGSTAVRLAGATEVEFVRLGDDAIALRLLQGTIDARVRNPEVARELSVETPEARATLLEPGRYRFDAGVEPETTAVSTDLGAARVEAGGSAFVVRPGKRAEVWRSGEIRLAEARPDAFDEWALALDRRAEAARSARYVSPEMTGHESLDEHGDWREIPDYGPVWVPRAVPVGWAPYRTGRWAWIEPWGWTWIDEAPWGFAPFHYGRWAFVVGTWCWVPGRVVARPVYAPALVGWVGRPGWSVSVSIGTVPAVGWFPLAPREVYVPAHRHSPGYVRNVNVAHVTNVTQITNVTNVNYVNRHIERAVTVVPAAAVAQGQPVARSHVHVHRAELERHAPASPTPPTAVAAPPRPVTPQARRDDDPQRRFEPAPRPQEAPRAERREERRPDVRTQPAPSAQATPATPPRAVEARPEPRQAQRREAQRVETPRAGAPAAPAQPPAQAQPRNEPRMTESRPNPRQEERRELQRMEPSRAAAPAAAQPRQAPPQTESRREPQRAEPPRAMTAAPSSPPQAQPRHEPRAAPPAPVVRAAPSAAPAAIPQPQPQERSTPREDRDRGQGREQRRGEGRGAG